VSGNCGAHEELETDRVKFFFLPPYCTSIHQSLHLGIIACLKRRSKRRLLDLVVGAFEASTKFRTAARYSRSDAGGGGKAPAEASTVGGPAAAATAPATAPESPVPRSI